PSDLLSAGGYRTQRYPLALVQTRERSAPDDVTRTDEEPGMARAVELPTQRQYRLTGNARLSARASATVVDALLGRGGPDAVAVSASSTLPGGLRAAPSNAVDGDRSTWWTSEFRIEDGEHLRIITPQAVPV